MFTTLIVPCDVLDDVQALKLPDSKPSLKTIEALAKETKLQKVPIRKIKRSNVVTILRMDILKGLLLTLFKRSLVHMRLKKKYRTIFLKNQVSTNRREFNSLKTLITKWIFFLLVKSIATEIAESQRFLHYFHGKLYYF